MIRYHIIYGFQDSCGKAHYLDVWITAPGPKEALADSIAYVEEVSLANDWALTYAHVLEALCTRN